MPMNFWRPYLNPKMRTAAGRFNRVIPSVGNPSVGNLGPSLQRWHCSPYRQQDLPVSLVAKLPPGSPNNNCPTVGGPPAPPFRRVPGSLSLSLLSLAQERAYSGGCLKGARWLVSQVYPELPVIQSFVQHTLGLSPSQGPGSSPWFPGTAGWVIPTALSILSLSCWSSRLPGENLNKTVQRAQTYLLSRRCADGGWNHGGSLQRSEASVSYPETTGLALLALAGNGSPSLAPTLLLAESFYREPASPEGSAWLLMGLSAHGRSVVERQPPLRPKTNRDIALELIAFHTLRGYNPFLQPAL